MRIEPPSRTAGEVAGGVAGGLIGTFFRFFATVLLCLIVSIVVTDATASDGLGLVAFFGSGALLFPFWGRHIIRLMSWMRAPPQHTPAQTGDDDDPEELPEEAVVVGALVTEGRETDKLAYLSAEQRNRHVYVIGKTRTGKTTLLKNLIIQDMEAGRGVAFIDPHGDAAVELLGCVPKERIDDVVYFDPVSRDGPCFNPFALDFPAPKLTEDIVSVFKMFFGDSWGPRLEHLLRFGVLTLLSHPEPKTLVDLRRLFVDEGYRAELVAGITHQSIREFWAYEYPKIPANAAGPLLNKLSVFLAPTSDLERVFSQPQNDLDFSAILNDGKVLIVNLAKGVIGDEPSRVLGGLIVAGIQQAALARASMPAEQRRDFYLFVDEFQNYVVASFESILAESAKYRLNLTLANQNLGQLPKSLERAIFGNCATLAAFQVSAEDAPHLQREMHYADTIVRTKSTNDFYSLSDFAHYQRELYRAALTDDYLGMPADERRNLRGLRRFRPSPSGFVVGARDQYIREGTAKGVLAERQAYIAQVLRVLEDEEGLEITTLRELFRDYEFRQRCFPEPGDFTNLPPRHAIIRVGRAEDVAAIRTLPCSAPDPERKKAVLAKTHCYKRVRVDAETTEVVTLEEQLPLAAEPQTPYVRTPRRRRPPALS